MRLSTSTNIYFNRPDGTKADITDSMRRCAAAGYRVMDLNFHDCTTFRLPFVSNQYQRWTEEIGELAEELGLSFNQAHSAFYNFCDERYTNREYMDGMVLRTIECAGVLGIPYVVIHAGTDFESAEYRRTSKQKNTEYFLPLIEFAEKKNTRLVFENLWDLNIYPLRRYTANAEELVDFVDSLNAPSVGICYDTDHVTLMGQSHSRSLYLIGKRLVATHISDCISVECDHILPYSGRIDWDEVTLSLRKTGYSGDFTYEIHRYTQSLPDALVDSALRYSVEVGEHLISKCR